MKLERMGDVCGCAQPGTDAGDCAQLGADVCAGARPLPGAPGGPARDDAPC